MSLSIVEFLNARYDELAERAKATTEADLIWLADYADDVGLRAAATFIRAVTPLSVLADVDIKRLLVVEHRPMKAVYQGQSLTVCMRCSDFAGRGELLRPVVSPCRTLRLLALPHATHPDYDPAWAVTE